jgi:hypothetical protein
MLRRCWLRKNDWVCLVVFMNIISMVKTNLEKVELIAY